MVGTEAVSGLMPTSTATAAIIVTLAEADLVVSATLVAFTETTAGEGTLAGGAYTPVFEIVPHVAALQPAPATLQVTPEFDVPVTFASNCWSAPTVTDALIGLTVIARCGALTLSLAALLVVLPMLLPTSTVNVVPSSELVVGGVV
jgi:hypothetical protein